MSRLRVSSFSISLGYDVTEHVATPEALHFVPERR
jgi:hypothetical protein